MVARNRRSIVALLALVPMMLGAVPAARVGGQHLDVPDVGVSSHQATLTIHNRLCPDYYKGSNYYRDCHANPVEDMGFKVSGPERASAKTDAKGNVTFELEPGRYRVRGGVPLDFARLNVYCSEGRAPFPFKAIDGGSGTDDPIGIRLRLRAGDNVVCDWYNTPESQR